jgi:hypothetical protein
MTRMNKDNFIIRVIRKQIADCISLVPSARRLVHQAIWVLTGALAMRALFAVFQPQSKVI